MPNKKELIYPFFLECLQYCEDSFWENIFEQLAFGYPIYGTFINKGFLCCSYKNKEFSYKIERKEPKILFNDIYDLFTKKLEILSKKQKIQKKLQFEDLEKNIQDTRLEWITIRKKNVKDLLYEKFVLDNKEKYNLTWQQSKHLLSIILLCMIFKTISSKDIIYKNGKIETINGFEFKKNDVILNKNLTNLNNTTVKEEIEECKLMSHNWNKYLENIENCLI